MTAHTMQQKIPMPSTNTIHNQQQATSIQVRVENHMHSTTINIQQQKVH